MDIFEALRSHDEELAWGRALIATTVADLSSAPTSVLLALFIGLSVGRGFGVSGSAKLDGTEQERDMVLGAVGEELNRRIPVP